jgi:hypothetical protein
VTDGFTSWTSWTTSHNASRAGRQTLLVDVDYGRKATSHKRLKQPRRWRRCFAIDADAKGPAEAGPSHIKLSLPESLRREDVLLREVNSSKRTPGGRILHRPALSASW